MRKIAIISFFHTESSICLAKHIAKQKITVDYYCITDILRDKGYMAGFEYFKAKKRPGIIKLREKEIPEIYQYTRNLPISFFLIRIISFSNKLLFLNKLILHKALGMIKQKKYDSINIVGQHPWIGIIHDELKHENITHTLHEIGTHSNNNVNISPLLQKIIIDRTKVIVHSQSTLERFLQIPDASKVRSTIIPFGNFETLLLYNKSIQLNISLDLSKPTFLFYGYIKPYKGLELLKEATKLLTDISDKYNLIIAGGGKDSSLEYFSTQNNCQVINHHLTNEEMINLIQTSAVIVLPYKSASQSGIPCTVFQYGKPIIATNVGALGETITDNINGLLTNNTATDFAYAMKKIIEDKEFLTKLEQGALTFGKEDRFNWDKLAKSAVSFL